MRNESKCRALLVAVAGLAGTAVTGVPLTSQGRTGPEASCSVIRLQAQAPQGTTITAAAVMPPSGEVKQYCRVDGHVATNGNTVNFGLGLPADWNGKFYFQGVGGFGGAIGPLNLGLARGYASASTDTGHQAAASDGRFALDPMQELDYAYRGTHATTLAAKHITAAFYGRQPRHSYFNGCSNGGRQGLLEVQRYPDDFDGVIAGAPGFGTTLQVARALLYQVMLAKPGNALPVEKVELISEATLEECDARDGLRDGLISDPRLCRFTPEALKCSGSDRPDCLTASQIATAKIIYDGVMSPAVGVVTPGQPIGHEGGESGWRRSITGSVAPTPQPDGTTSFTKDPPNGFTFGEQNFRYMALPDDDPSFTWRTFNLERDLHRLAAAETILAPNKTDLSPFRRRGGKLILWHGWADPMVTAYWTVRYYENVAKAMGPRETEDVVRLFMVPGMHHCSGGPGPNAFDMLSEIERWVERGIPPERVIASHSTDGRVDRTRPLCAYPKVARYVGQGSIDDASSFTCEAAPAR